MSRTELLVVLTAPSGTGKSSVVRALLALEPRLAFSVSHTTRPPRPGERDGVDYHFVSREGFERIRRDQGFLEWAEVHGQHYGTARTEVERPQVLLDVDVQGARRIASMFAEAVTIFLLPPDHATLERRLRGRRSETEEDVDERLRTAAVEVRHYAEFRYLVVNESIDQATAEIRSILAAERARTERRRSLAERIVSTFPDSPR